MPTNNQPAPAIDAMLSIIDGLTAQPFPERESRPGADGRWGGPGYHLAVLRESRDFWEDRSSEIVEAAQQELEAGLTALTHTLTGRWAAPTTVDLGPYLGLDEPDPGFEAPEPLGFLSGVATDMRVWRLPSTGRWLGLTIGQADAEWPLQLLAAVGDASSLPVRDSKDPDGPRLTFHAPAWTAFISALG